MAITFVESTAKHNNETGPQNGHEIDVPAGVQEGDLLVVVAKSVRRFDEAQTGWTFEYQAFESLSDSTNIYTRVATSDEPASYTFVLANDETKTAGLVMLAYREVDDPPFNVGDDVHTYGTVSTPDVTTTVANTVLLRIWTLRHNGTNPSPVNPLTVRAQALGSVTNDGDILVAEETQGAAGATGAEDCDVLNSNINFTIALTSQPVEPTQVIVTSRQSISSLVD